MILASLILFAAVLLTLVGFGARDLSNMYEEPAATE